jgi:hypothetical protein
MILVVKCYSDLDPEALNYIRAVELADGQPLESTTRNAIDGFIRGCKVDNIWNAINSSCILAGARTLNGCLVPLKGTAPTNAGGLFVAGDYNRKNGLTGNGTTKYLDSNVASNSVPLNDLHYSVWKNNVTTVSGMFLGSNTSQVSGGFIRNRSVASPSEYNGVAFNFLGTSRNNESDFSWATNETVTSFTASPSTTEANNFCVFCRNAPTPTAFSAVTLKFYSIGPNLDLALLYARLNTLFTDINNAF